MATSRTIGPERSHFGGENGVIMEIVGSKNRYFWRCIHCGFELGGKAFQNGKARIHLSGDPSLRNGSIAQLCDKAPSEVQQQFALLERKRRLQKEQRVATRKRAAELMGVSTPSPVRSKRVQRTLPFRSQSTSDFVDLAWAKSFFGLDIPPAKISHPLFREAIKATQRSNAS